jgi:hypothetical protein
MIANLLRRTARSILVFAGLVAVSVAQPVMAESDSAFSLHGFGTIGLARTTSDDVEFVRDLSQPRGIKKDWSPLIDSVLGLQAAWRFSPQIEAVVQANSRYRHDKTFSPDIAWAYLKYEPTPNLSFRAGRLGTEFFMMADSRWVGYSFLTVRPPGDFFWYLPFYSIHGADAALTIPLGETVLRAKAFYGHSDGQIPLANEQWNITDSPMLGGYVEYEYGSWLVRASYANILFKHDLPYAQVLKQQFNILLTQAQSDFLVTRNMRSHYYSLGFVFDQGPWQGQLMLNHIEQGSNAFESSDGGYVLAGYRVGEATPYLGYSWVNSREKARLVTGNLSVDTVTDYVMGDSHSDQKTTFVGVRWDVVRDVAVKAQWDSIHGDPKTYFPYRQEKRSRWDGTIDVFSLTLDFVF